MAIIVGPAQNRRRDPNESGQSSASRHQEDTTQTNRNHDLCSTVFIVRMSNVKTIKQETTQSK